MNETPKNCPFCGCEGGRVHSADCFLSLYKAFLLAAQQNADLCGAPGVIKAWNRRAALSAPPAAGVLIGYCDDQALETIRHGRAFSVGITPAQHRQDGENNALYTAPPASEQLTDAARDVLAERRRQVEDEQWTPEHDDRYRQRQLAMAAACYAAAVPVHDVLDCSNGQIEKRVPAMPSAWPWAASWWKPGTARKNLVRAGALILAEIERLDRALKSTGTPAQRHAATMPTVPPRKSYTQELAGVAEQLAEGSGWWDACTGCHETGGGRPVCSYHYSEALRCSLGRGCTECGGIGAVWHRAKEWLPTVEEEAALNQGVPDTNERTVIIPGCDQHEGLYSLSVTLQWACLHCGGPRGEPFDSLSFDGSRRLKVHSWSNPCGHIETYAEVRATLTGLPAGRPSEAEESQP